MTLTVVHPGTPTPKGRRKATPTAQQILWESTSESQLQDTVVELLEAHHWKVMTIRKSAYVGKSGKVIPAVTSAGFPDVLALSTRPNAFRANIVAWELKVESLSKGVVSPEQEEWLKAWRLCGADTRVVRPSNLDAVIRWVQE